MATGTAAIPLLLATGLIGYPNLGTVYLMRRRHLIGCNTETCVKTAAVFGYVLGIILRRTTQV